MFYERHLRTWLFSFLFFAPALKAQVATPEAVKWTKLKADLEGFAHATTGGLNGDLYTVTDLSDYGRGETPIPGTLRWGIENSDPSRPVWIVFDPRFGSAPRAIVLRQGLSARSHMTIDGRGVQISIMNRIDWSLYERKDNGTRFRAECRVKPGARPSVGTLISITARENIILTHLKLTRENYHGSPWEITDPNMDKECLGDLISIANRANPGDVPTRNIWIHHISFEKCGDGCLDATRPARVAMGISVSHSLFVGTDKSILFAAGRDMHGEAVDKGRYFYRLSAYRNKFDRAQQRNPAVSGGMIAHVYNNFYHDWSSVTLSQRTHSKAFFEANLLNAVRRRTAVGNDGGAYLYGNRDIGLATSLQDMRNYPAYRSDWIRVPSRITPASLLAPHHFNRAGWTLDSR